MNAKADLSLAPLFAAIDAGDAEVISRAVLALYRRQTSDEQATQSTRVQNGRGFTAFDAKQGSYMGKWVEGGKTLSGRFLAKAQNMLPRYHRQLAEELSFIMMGEALPAVAQPKAVRIAHGAESKFAHDCDHCKFLGNAEVNGEMVDLYVCEADSCCLYRHGNEPCENGAVDFATAESVPGTIYSFIAKLAKLNLPVATYRLEGM